MGKGECHAEEGLPEEEREYAAQRDGRPFEDMRNDLRRCGTVFALSYFL